MTRLVFDIESDGLLDTITKLHCIVTIDLDTEEIRKYHDSSNIPRTGTIQEGLEALSTAETVIAHNYIGFDRRAILKLFPSWEQPVSFHDTYILSQMLYANEMEQHGIDAWGRYFGRFKPKHEDWHNFSEEMLYRCVEDTQILKLLFDKLSKSNLDSMKEAIDLEYKVYEIDSEYSYWFLNLPRLHKAIDRLRIIRPKYERKLINMAGPRARSSGALSRLFKKDGNVNAIASKYCEMTGIDPQTIAGPFSKLDWEEINPASTSQMVEWLIGEGWLPDEYNYKKGKDGKPLKDERGELIISSPKLTGDFLGVRHPALRETLKQFNILNKRLGTLEGWAKKAKGNVIETFAYTCGTNTARYRHKGVVNVPKADERVYLGRLMRSLFVAPLNYVLVGCDASQLESRIEGHFTSAYDQGDYAKFLLEEDIHQRTADKLGLTRGQGKTLNYALQYGCSYKKVALLLDVNEHEARDIVDMYWDMRPAATQLKEDLTSALIKRGYNRKDNLYNTRAYIRTIDKRPIFVRSWHSLVNSLIQSTGSICMKRALVLANEKVNKENLRARLAIMYHDEMQWICLPQDSERMKVILKDSIREAGEYYNLRIPLVGEAKCGKNWEETH